MSNTPSTCIALPIRLPSDPPGVGQHAQRSLRSRSSISIREGMLYHSDAEQYQLRLLAGQILPDAASACPARKSLRLQPLCSHATVAADHGNAWTVRGASAYVGVQPQHRRRHGSTDKPGGRAPFTDGLGGLHVDKRKQLCKLRMLCVCQCVSFQHFRRHRRGLCRGQ